ncbi:MAG: TRAP transporter substrate-binding protein, partial [Bacteroidota bacterium]
MRFSFLLLFAFLLFACDDSTSVKSLKLAHGLDVTHPVHKGMEHLAEKVKEKSSGKLQIEIYPSQQLG